MPEPSHKQADPYVLAALAGVVVAGLGLGGGFVWLSLLVAGLAGLVWLWLRRAQWIRYRPAARQAAGSQAGHGLWRDVEQTLRLIDVFPQDAGLEEHLDRLGHAGRRLVENGRHRPAEPDIAQARQLLCMAGDMLTRYLQASPSARDRRREQLLSVLRDTAQTLERVNAGDDDDQHLRLQLRLLERQLGKETNSP